MLLNRKRGLMAFAVGALAIVSVCTLRFIPFNNDIGVMLPQHPEILQTFRFFRESPFSGNVLLSFELEEGKGEFPDLIHAVEALISQIDSPMIARVLSGVDTKQAFKDMQEFVRLSPQIMGEEQLQALDSKLNETYIQEKMKELYRSLLSPAGFFTGNFQQQDPLGFHQDALKNLKSLLASAYYDVELRSGQLISRDGRHALVILETTVPVTDGFGARRLVDYLDALIADIPGPVSVDLISGHLHSISNEKTIKRDIAVTLSVAGAAFLMLFVFLFKDLRALLLFLIPSLSVLMAVHVCSWVLGQLSYIIMGMGAVISGIAIDYCIHVYVAMRSGQKTEKALSEVTKPVVIGALTTAGVFCVFLFSQVPGYRQLALFTIVSILLSLALALLFLPHFLTRQETDLDEKQALTKSGFSTADRLTIGLWILLVLGSLVMLPRIHFKSDVKQYDGSSKAIFTAEEKFQSVWGEPKQPAMLVAKAPSFDEALSISDQIYPEVSGLVGENRYAHLVSVWPPKKKRIENLSRWNRFWEDHREVKLLEMIHSHNAAYDFSQEVFAPVFERLYLEPAAIESFEQIGLLQQLKNRFVFKIGNEFHVTGFFPDEEPLVQKLKDQSKQWPHVYVVSSAYFTNLLSKLVISEAVYLSCAIALLLPALCLFFLRRISLMFIALVPVVTSVLMIFGVLALFNMTLNAANIIAVLVVGGLTIDYGIFMVHKHLHQLKTDTWLAVTLSALTTLFGAGALLFAKHPVLLSYGITMGVGISAGYLSAVTVVPALFRWMKRERVTVNLCQPV